MAPGRTWTVAILLLLAPVLSTPSAMAQGSFGEGPHYVGEALVVGPDDTLVLGPGTSLTGPGSLEVQGRLEVRGEPGRPAQIALPIRLLGNQSHVLSHARLWGVDGAAVTLLNGTLRVDDALFEASGDGLVLGPGVTAQGANVTFRAQSGAGLRVGPDARADLDAVRLEDNGAGVVVLPGGSLRLAGVHASGNRVHLTADLPPVEDTAQGPRVLVLDADLGATAQGAASGVRLTAVPGNGSASAPSAMLFGGRIHDAPVGIQATGPDLRLRIEGVAVEDNGVGLALDQATVEMKDVRLANGRDVEGGETSRLSMENVTRASEPVVASGFAPQTWPWWVPWLAMGGVLVLAAAILWTARTPRARRSSAPPSPPMAPPSSMPAPAMAEPEAPEPSGPSDAPPLAAPLSELGTQERRILADIVQHPDTAQAAVAERLGLSRQAVHYHVKKLEVKGLIRKTTKGRETQCRASEGAAAALAEAPAGP